MQVHWYALDIRPNHVTARRVGSEQAAELLAAAQPVLLGDRSTLVAVAQRHQCRLRLHDSTVDNGTPRRVSRKAARPPSAGSLCSPPCAAALVMAVA